MWRRLRVWTVNMLSRRAGLRKCVIFTGEKVTGTTLAEDGGEEGAVSRRGCVWGYFTVAHFTRSLILDTKCFASSSVFTYFLKSSAAHLTATRKPSLSEVL